MKKLIIVVFLLIGLVSFSQEINAIYIDSTSLKADEFIGIDNFNNWYYVYQNILYKKKDTSMVSYTNFQLGNITSVSINNPFNIIVFYRDYNTIIILDNHLNKKQQIYLGNNTITHVSYAFADNIWMYNLDNQQLELYNYKSDIKIATTQPSAVLQVKKLESNAKNVYFLDNVGNLSQFNNYGNLVNYDRNLAADRIFVFGEKVVCLRNKVLFLKNTEWLKIVFKKTPYIKDIYLDNDNLFIFNGYEILRFKLSKNE